MDVMLDLSVEEEAGGMLAGGRLEWKEAFLLLCSRKTVKGCSGVGVGVMLLTERAHPGRGGSIRGV